MWVLTYGICAQIVYGIPEAWAAAGAAAEA